MGHKVRELWRNREGLRGWLVGLEQGEQRGLVRLGKAWRVG